jgi:hypothetical protein
MERISDHPANVSAMPDDPHGAPDGDRTVDPGPAPRSRQRAGLRPPWHKGQSGNPGGRSKQTLWFRDWCRRLLAHHGLAILALKVKQGDMTAIRLALAYAYGSPPTETETGNDPHEEPDLTASPDLAQAEAAIAPNPPPRPKTREEEIEDLLLQGAREHQDRRARLAAAGLSETTLDRIIEADHRAADKVPF